MWYQATDSEHVLQLMSYQAYVFLCYMPVYKQSTCCLYASNICTAVSSGDTEYWREGLYTCILSELSLTSEKLDADTRMRNSQSVCFSFSLASNFILKSEKENRGPDLGDLITIYRPPPPNKPFSLELQTLSLSLSIFFFLDSILSILLPL